MLSQLAPVTEDDLRWLRDRWRGKLVVKGVMRADEVPRLIGLGVDGIVVSNHGGRNLDSGQASILVLPEVIEAAGSAEVFVDGGIRRGTDVIKALGARCARLPHRAAVCLGARRWWRGGRGSVAGDTSGGDRAGDGVLRMCDGQ
jgi:hypothetical protein